MKLVEKHIIKKNHEFYKECDSLCFKSKNLYNSAIYFFRQSFIHNNISKGYKDMYYELRYKKDYSALPDKISKQTLKLASQNISSYFAAIKEYKKNPSKFLGRPRLPKYKDKLKGRQVTAYEAGALSKTIYKKEGLIGLSQTNIKIKSKIPLEKIKQVRVVPGIYNYSIEIVYDILLHEKKECNGRLASVDMGVNNLMVVTHNDKMLTPIIFNGKPLKSINQYYNKRKAKLQSLLPEKQYTSNKIKATTFKRNKKINDYLHKASSLLVNHLVSNNINTLVIGKNDNWKQGTNMGKANNQKFINIPFATLIRQITYKCQMKGITVLLQEESYTSKCSFLDGETPCKHETYKGKRIKRGLFKTSFGKKINADVNGSYNIMVKAVPNAFYGEGIEGVAVRPSRYNIAC